ncbi:MAG TPA: amidase family protein [Opitutaceae bacterium]|nr:amidase family protein [Opitutaceae bacterium]HND62687.1 amidase family protein [Opitutaceae bacterium]
MTIADWQDLTPSQAARLVHERVAELRPGQRRAILVNLTDEQTLTAALAAAPRPAPLGGLPCLVKDLFPVAGRAMLAGSEFLPEVRPPASADSALVQRLRARGAVLAGRTHLHEFAYGITGENPHYGDCEHPQFEGRTSGGSSSGSAAAVAAGIVPFAIGTDTGGSVRIPAAFCGLFGLRLTPGDELIRDAFPLSPSFDTAGWFTTNAADLATVTRALVGLAPVERHPRGCYLELPGLDIRVSRAFGLTAASRAEQVDTETRDALLGVFAEAVDTYNVIVADEAWSVHQPWAERYRDRYDPAVWQRLNRVHQITPAQREAARTSADRIRRIWTAYFRSYDYLILPGSPLPALTKAECTLENRSRILALTAPASVGGCPVLTIPVPLASGLTTALQIVVPNVQSQAIAWFLSQYGA